MQFYPIMSSTASTKLFNDARSLFKYSYSLRHWYDNISHPYDTFMICQWVRGNDTYTPQCQRWNIQCEREIFSDNILSALSHQNRVCTFIETEYELIIEKLIHIRTYTHRIERQKYHHHYLNNLWKGAEHWFDLNKKNDNWLGTQSIIWKSFYVTNFSEEFSMLNISL